MVNWLFQFTGALHISSSTVGEEEKVSTLAMPEHVPTGMGLPHATPTQSQFSISQVGSNNQYSFVDRVILNPDQVGLYIDLLT
jgi:hypothetical protein